MQPDPRLQSVSSFTKTKHSAIPASLNPETASLPSTFTVCIIGASKGIGEHIAYAYAKAGATQICIASRTVVDLDPVAANIKAINATIHISTAPCDIASAASVAALAELVRATFGRLDIIIPNAAYAPPIAGMDITQGSPAAVQRAFDVNVLGTYHVAHHFIPLLLNTPQGAMGFIAIGSLAGCIRRGIIANPGYTISKMAQIRLVEYIAEQYGEQGVFAVALHPGAVQTGMAAGNTPDAFLEYLVDDVALCGAVCVWLSARVGEVRWLSGRLVSANWDMEELMGRKGEVVQGDLLKWGVITE